MALSIWSREHTLSRVRRSAIPPTSSNACATSTPAPHRGSTDPANGHPQSVLQHQARQLAQVVGELLLVHDRLDAQVAEPVDVAVRAGLAAADGAEVDALH